MLQTMRRRNTVPLAALGLAMCLSLLTLTSCASAPRKSAKTCIPVPLIPKEALQQKTPPPLNSESDVVEWALDLLHIIDAQNSSLSLVRRQLDASPRVECH